MMVNKDSWFVLMFSKPNIYLANLLRQTLMMGVFLTIVYYLLLRLGIKSQSIPSNMHGLIGVVIGLLLVFRTNTAYDRWWEARKKFSEFESVFTYLYIKYQNYQSAHNIIEALRNLNDFCFDYLESDDENKDSKIKNAYRFQTKLLYEQIKENKHLISDREFGNVDKKIEDLILIFSSFERIKETPIPSSYSFHIKVSVFAYLLTLPLGLFFGLGFYSIPLVMTLFFIIAGIEIISSEIENPFRGDPNDLPIKLYRKRILEILK